MVLAEQIEGEAVLRGRTGPEGRFDDIRRVVGNGEGACGANDGKDGLVIVACQ